MTEPQFKSSLVKSLRKREIFHITQAQPVIRGHPDVVFCFRERCFGVELKLKGNVPTPIQFNELHKLLRGGGVAYVATLDGEMVDVVRLLIVNEELTGTRYHRVERKKFIDEFPESLQYQP